MGLRTVEKYIYSSAVYVISHKRGKWISRSDFTTRSLLPSSNNVRNHLKMVMVQGLGQYKALTVKSMSK